VRIFKTKWVARFARRERISDASLQRVKEEGELQEIDDDKKGE